MKPFIKYPDGLFSSPEKLRLAKLSNMPPELFCLTMVGTKSSASMKRVIPSFKVKHKQ
ncbi:uncharacterized protein METZ01_LOCUS363332, partial [marine metagenome]